MYRAMIVEDSRLARLELRSQLEHIENVELLAEAKSLSQARELLQTHTIDLLFLDIDLPDGNGFEFFREGSAQGNGGNRALHSVTPE